MNQIISYLTFNGNCREAMSFYQSCLGGALSFQTVGDNPRSEKLPQVMKEYIVHATLRKEHMLLMGTDMIAEKLSRGNSVSILLECSSHEELRRYYENLATSGETTQPVTKTYWGALFGGLTDKYGIQWLLHYKNRRTPEITTDKHHEL